MKAARLICLMIVFFYGYGVAVCEGVTAVKYQVDSNYPPYTFKNRNYLHGFDPSLTTLIFDTTEYSVDYSADSWEAVYPRLVSGEIDIGGVIAVTAARKREVLFTKPLFTSYVALYTARPNFKVTVEKLQNLKVGVGQGYYTESLLRNRVGIHDYRAYADLGDALNDLVAGKIDVIFENQQLMDYLVISKNLKGVVASQTTQLFPREHAYAVTRNRPELVEYMNARIEQLQDAGVFEELYVKFFLTHSDTYEKAQRRKNLMLLAGLIFGLIVFAAATKIYTNHLKRRIEANYNQLMAAHEELTATEEELRVQYEQLALKQDELEASEERYKLVAEGANDGLLDWDVVSDTGYLSQKWSNRLGHAASEIGDFSRQWEGWIHPADRDSALKKLRSYRLGFTEQCDDEFRIVLPDGQELWVLLKGKIVRDEAGKMIRLAGSLTDISERKAYEAKIYNLAYYDSLTRLPNRALLGETLKNFASVPKSFDKKTAVFLIGLDNFKGINDALGHDIGDLVLEQAGEKIRRCVDPQCFVARFGNDEYVVLAPDLPDMGRVVAMADSIRALFGRIWQAGGWEVFVSASIGITIIPDHGTDIQKIMKNADAAMFAAKEDGKGIYRIFQEEMLKKLQSKMELEQSLRRALEQREFVLHYQPYFDAATGEILGMEALIRWLCPGKGLIAPGRFIPAAEEAGLIPAIGAWVLAEAVRQNKAWQAQGLKPIPVSVNIAENQLRTSRFVREVREILTTTGLDPAFLTLEITESSVMNSVEHNADKLRELQELGVKIALDDFGTGYSSLSYLQQLPLNIVKIDKSFVDSITQEYNEQLIIEEIISIAHKLKLEVVAEGVETQSQREYLMAQQCDKLQGFLLAKPLPAAQMETYLRLDSAADAS